MMLAALADDMAAVNIQLVTALAERFRFGCRFVRSSDLSLCATSDERLVEISLKLAPGGSYLSGSGAAKYQDPEKFRAAGLGFEYSRFVHPRYAQSAQPGLTGFVPGLSVLDAVFHLGWERTAELIQDGGA
ncbi:MAG: hypothetical protein A3H93_15190 [Rhodocyclales bacterium RIFCSPLOWO2_02_FULL_63_24]|nr:MAG: hypothetical protein A3H93_15190 [Rhodocyclales bacterium RIFCSPLOWO2_02_FULL_63_24]